MAALRLIPVERVRFPAEGDWCLLAPACGAVLNGQLFLGIDRWPRDLPWPGYDSLPANSAGVMRYEDGQWVADGPPDSERCVAVCNLAVHEGELWAAGYALPAEVEAEVLQYQQQREHGGYYWCSAVIHCVWRRLGPGQWQRVWHRGGQVVASGAIPVDYHLQGSSIGPLWAVDGTAYACHQGTVVELGSGGYVLEAGGQFWLVYSPDTAAPTADWELVSPVPVPEDGQTGWLQYAGPVAWRGRLWIVGWTLGSDAAAAARLDPGGAWVTVPLPVPGPVAASGLDYYSGRVRADVIAAAVPRYLVAFIGARWARDDADVAYDGLYNAVLGYDGLRAYGEPWTERVLVAFAHENRVYVVSRPQSEWPLANELEERYRQAGRTYRLGVTPERLAVDILRLEYGDGSGTNRPQVDRVQASWARDRAWTNQPAVDRLLLEYGDGSGSNRPRVDALELQYSDGSGTSEPRIDSIQLEFSAGSADEKARRSPGVDTLRLEYGRGAYEGPQQGERILWLLFDRPNAWGMRVSVPGRPDVTIIYRVNRESLPVDQWSSYEVCEHGQNILLPAHGTVRIGIIEPAGEQTEPPDVYVQFLEE